MTPLLERPPTHLTITPFTNGVYHSDALTLLSKMPDTCANEVITDAMYMVASQKGPATTYAWGEEPGKGTAEEYWEFHRTIYDECRRVLKPGGMLAWGVASKHYRHFARWFGGHMSWHFTRELGAYHNRPFPSFWIVQTKEQEPVRFPNESGFLVIDRTRLRKQRFHPCPKSEEEMRFMVRHLSQPGDTILDCFCGTGTTLVAAKQLGRNWIGCDREETYCRFSKFRLKRTTAFEGNNSDHDIFVKSR